jgi:hypothetical protein
MACAVTGSGSVAPNSRTPAAADALRVVAEMDLDRELAAARGGELDRDRLAGPHRGGRHRLVVAVEVEDAVRLRVDDQDHVLVATDGGIARSEIRRGQCEIDRHAGGVAGLRSRFRDAAGETDGDDEHQHRATAAERHGRREDDQHHAQRDRGERPRERRVGRLANADAEAEAALLGIAVDRDRPPSDLVAAFAALVDRAAHDVALRDVEVDITAADDLAGCTDDGERAAVRIELAVKGELDLVGRRGEGGAVGRVAGGELGVARRVARQGQQRGHHAENRKPSANAHRMPRTWTITGRLRGRAGSR